MRQGFRKAVSLTITSALVFSMAGCSLGDKSKEEVLEVAEDYAKNLAACKISKLAKATVEDFDDDKDEWEERLTFSSGDFYDDDTAEAVSAIADTISYEIDEESVEASKKSGEGSVTVVFTIADYEPLVGDEDLVRIDDFLDALDDADTTEIEISIEFEKEDEEWLCSNYEEVFEELYAFTDADYDFTIPLTDYIRGVEWYGGDGDGNYVNTNYIDCYLNIDYEAPVEYTDIYFRVEHNGQELFSDLCYGEAYLTVWDIDGYTDPSGSFFEAGTYTITFYLDDGTDLLTCEANVTVEEIEMEFEENLYWYFTDNYDQENPVYTNTDEIDGMLQYSGDIYYYYLAPYATIAYEGEVFYEESDTNEIWLFVDSSYYDVPLDPSGEYFAAGTYTITFYDADGNVIVSDSCTVVVE